METKEEGWWHGNIEYCCRAEHLLLISQNVSGFPTREQNVGREWKLCFQN